MTGQILVVDDIPANVSLLEAKLTGEYYDVVTAADGFEAIKQAKKHMPDIILLDVMMPGMDGFETCKKIKEDPEISHIPVVMVTALSEKSDRLKGLESGADDFLTKPINDTALLARVKSLIRIKTLLDELRLRDQTSTEMGIEKDKESEFSVDGSKVLLVDDDTVQGKRIVERLSEFCEIEWLEEGEGALEKAKSNDYDIVLISTTLPDMDGLRLASQIKTQEESRHSPLMVLVDEDDERLMFKALELGINDYLTMPIDRNEMVARVRTQIRRKRYQEALRSNYQKSMSMAVTDGLTGLYNRHYLNNHLDNMVQRALQSRKPLALMIMDMDHFKDVNDTHGHDAGDMVLKQLSGIIVEAVRSTDLVARFGGEEFVVLMPETDEESAMTTASRVREEVEAAKFKINAEGGTIEKTISIGVACLHSDGDTVEDFMKRADNVLYEAKDGGRNQVKMAS